MHRRRPPALSIMVDTFGTAHVDESAIERAVTSGLTCALALFAISRPATPRFLEKTAAYGHFGRRTLT